MTKKPETLAEKIERYKKMNETQDSDNSDDLFYAITKDQDPAAIPLFLLLRPFGENAKYHDEMEAIVEAMSNYPSEVFLAEFVKVAGELCRSSPRMLRRLLEHILWDDADTNLFLARLEVLTADDRKCLTGCIEEMNQSLKYPHQIKNCRIILDRLSELTGPAR